MGTLPLDQIVAAVMFAGVRIGGMMTFAPFFNSQSISIPVKAVFTIALTALLYPVYGVAGIGTGSVGWIRIAGGEAIIGLLLGLTLQFVFDAAQLAGQIFGVQTGFSLVTLLDPQTQADTPVLAVFNQMVLLMLFLQLNVHHWLLRGLAASFVYLPPGGRSFGLGLGLALLQSAGSIWLVGLQIAAPVIAATMATDVALGFLGRAAPQLPVLFLGLHVKSMLGLSVIAAMLALWPRIFERHFLNAILLGARLLHLAS
ncbi:MAG: flagellar biosynthetic protein FliR [Terriglobales bacterium]